MPQISCQVARKYYKNACKPACKKLLILKILSKPQKFATAFVLWPLSVQAKPISCPRLLPKQMWSLFTVMGVKLVYRSSSSVQAKTGVLTPIIRAMPKTKIPQIFSMLSWHNSIRVNPSLSSCSSIWTYPTKRYWKRHCLSGARRLSVFSNPFAVKNLTL